MSRWLRSPLICRESGNSVRSRRRSGQAWWHPRSRSSRAACEQRAGFQIPVVEDVREEDCVMFERPGFGQGNGRGPVGVSDAQQLSDRGDAAEEGRAPTALDFWGFVGAILAGVGKGCDLVSPGRVFRGCGGAEPGRRMPRSTIANRRLAASSSPNNPAVRAGWLPRVALWPECADE